MSEAPPAAPDQPSASTSLLLGSSGTPRKRIRACDACRSLKTKCSQVPGQEKLCTARNFECTYLVQQASSERHRARGNRRSKGFPTEHLVTSPGLSQPVNLSTANPFMAISRPSSSVITPHITHNAPPEPISIPDSGDYSRNSKIEMRYRLWLRCLNVENLATARISLPACLLEPIPSLEYWCYLDRPDLFAAINDSGDPLQRMLSVIRFYFSKDLKLAKGEPVKPYDSFCGEYFRSHFDVPTNAVSFASPDPSEPPIFSWHLDEVETATSSVIPPQNAPNLPHSNSPSVRDNTEVSDRRHTRISANDEERHDDTDILGHHRVVFLKEKVSDDPPISAYWFECLDKGIEATGVDQISARTGVFGHTIEVAPGSQNQGIFVRIRKGAGSGETYRITHPRGSVRGLAVADPYVVLTDSTVITCSGGSGKQLRAIIEYKDKPDSIYPRFEVEGTIFTYTEGPEQEAWRTVMQVPKELVVATLEGCWRKTITWRKAGTDSKWPLIDLSQLAVVPKGVPPIREQLPNESRRFWENVTRYIRRKNFSEATRLNQAIEQEQQAVSVARKRFGIQYHARYFDSDISSGAPTLTPEGRRVLMEETHAFHESSASSSAESPIQQLHEPALKGSPKSLVTTVGQVFTRMKHWHQRGKRQKSSGSDDSKPPPKRKKRARRRLKRRGSGSSSGSGELAYTVSRSSGSGSGSNSPSKFYPNSVVDSTGSLPGWDLEPLPPPLPQGWEPLPQGTIFGAGYSHPLGSGRISTGEAPALYMGDMDSTASPATWGVPGHSGTVDFNYGDQIFSGSAVGNVRTDGVEPLSTDGGNGISLSGMQSSGHTDDEPNAMAGYVLPDWTQFW